MGDLVYPELSYTIVGLAYKIDNQVGYGFDEKTYADLFEKLLIKEKIDYKRELYAPILIDDQVVKKRYLDFLISDKIVVEFKVGNGDFKSAFNQLFQYLKINNLKLGLIIRFTKSGVKIKRVPNFM
jgi:GxxExxY protein